MRIDSPGGAPVEAERISTAINGLKAKHRKEVVAVISNLGASAAYMVALNADKIIAASTRSSDRSARSYFPWQLDKAIAKVDVAQRVYASRQAQGLPQPFTPVVEVDRKAQQLVDQMGASSWPG